MTLRTVNRLLAGSSEKRGRRRPAKGPRLIRPVANAPISAVSLTCGNQHVVASRVSESLERAGLVVVIAPVSGGDSATLRQLVRLLGRQLARSTPIRRSPEPLERAEASASAWRRHLDRLTDRLPKRQLEVLRALKRGYSEKEIARTLKISRHTVHIYVKMIYQHFDVHSCGELLALWIAD
jgi:DNA-binding NarL/FixJ family response regulator